MSDERSPGVLGGLPRTRPHRRSDKRPAASLAAEPAVNHAIDAARHQAQVNPVERTAKAAASGATKPTTTGKTKTKPATAGNTKPATTGKTKTKPATAGNTKPATTGKPNAKPATTRNTNAKPATTRNTNAKPATTRNTNATPTTAGNTKPANAPRPGPSPRPPVARDAPDSRPTPLGTAVQAAAELAEIGLMASARALRGALSRLPRR